MDAMKKEFLKKDVFQNHVLNPPKYETLDDQMI